jgi:hypothetical protein
MKVPGYVDSCDDAEVVDGTIRTPQRNRTDPARLRRARAVGLHTPVESRC